MDITATDCRVTRPPESDSPQTTELKALVQQHKHPVTGLDTKSLAHTIALSEHANQLAKDIEAILIKDGANPIELAHFNADVQDAIETKHKEDRLNPINIIRRELPNWWNSTETEDLRNGMETTVDLATIPYKWLGVALEAKTIVSIINQVRNEKFADAGMEVASLAAGKGVGKLLTDFGSKREKLNTAIELAVEKATQQTLKEDCFACKNQ